MTPSFHVVSCGDLGPIPGMIASLLGLGQNGTQEICLPHDVEKVQKGMPEVQEIRAAYRTMYDEFELAQVGFPELTRCWDAVDASDPQTMRGDQHFEALVQCARGCLDDFDAEFEGREVHLAKSHLGAFVDLLDQLRDVDADDMLTSVNVGPVVLVGPTGTVNELTRYGLLDHDFEPRTALSEAERRAREAYEAIMKPAQEAYQRAVLESIMKVVAPAAADLASSYDWETSDGPNETTYWHGEGSKRVEVKIPKVNREPAEEPATSLT